MTPWQICVENLTPKAPTSTMLWRPGRTGNEDVLTAIVQLLATRPMTTAELARATDSRRDTTSNRLERLTMDGVVVRYTLHPPKGRVAKLWRLVK